MKKRQLLSFMLALGMMASMALPSFTVSAAGLTQATDPALVDYKVLSSEDKEIISSLFDADYYLAQNPDLVDLYGNDKEKLLAHFYSCGIFEGRVCNPKFDPAAYASAYGDLKDVFGNDILMYYKHYVAVGASEDRNITTLEACADAGISVTPLSDSSVVITPEIYKAAVDLKVTDMKSLVNLASAVNYAASNGGSVVIVDESEPALATGAEEKVSEPASATETEEKVSEPTTSVEFEKNESKTEEKSTTEAENSTEVAENTTAENNNNTVENKEYQPVAVKYFGTISMKESYNGHNNPTQKGRSLLVVKGATGGFAITAEYSDYTLQHNYDNIKIYQTYMDINGVDFDNNLNDAVQVAKISVEVFTEDYLGMHGISGSDYTVKETGTKPEAETYNCIDLELYNYIDKSQEKNGLEYVTADVYADGHSTHRDVDAFDVDGQHYDTYEIGAGLRENDDQTITITFGVKNQESDFSYEATCTTNEVAPENSNENE